MRDHRKLEAFRLADKLAIEVYKITKQFPSEERFGLTAQLRSAAVSVASNIVEGCARRSEADLLRFLDIAYGSAVELQYQLSLAEKLSFVPPDRRQAAAALSASTCRALIGLTKAFGRTRSGPTSSR